MVHNNVKVPYTSELDGTSRTETSRGMALELSDPFDHIAAYRTLHGVQ